MQTPQHFNPDLLRDVIVEFPIPVAFNVPNCLEEKAELRYLVSIKEIPAFLWFARRYDFLYKYYHGADMAPYSRVEEDRAGNLSRMLVQVWFDRQISQVLPFPWSKIDSAKAVHFLGLALDYLNKFVRLYKAVSGEYWLRNLVRSDVFAYTFILRDSADVINFSRCLIPEHQRVEFNGGEEFVLAEEHDSHLRDELCKDNNYNFWRELRMDMENNFSLGNFNIAVVQAVTSFENFVYMNLRGRLSKTKWDKARKKPDCGCLVGIKELCDRGIREYLEKDFASSDEFRGLSEALTTRNHIVHGKTLGQITEEECKKCIGAIFAAEAFLRKNVFSKEHPAI